MYDPKGESASMTRAATANVSSKAIRDGERQVGRIRSEDYCSGPAPVSWAWALWRGALELPARSPAGIAQYAANPGSEAESPRGSDKLDSTSITTTTVVENGFLSSPSSLTSYLVLTRRHRSGRFDGTACLIYL